MGQIFTRGPQNNTTLKCSSTEGQVRMTKQRTDTGLSVTLSSCLLKPLSSSWKRDHELTHRIAMSSFTVAQPSKSFLFPSWIIISYSEKGYRSNALFTTRSGTPVSVRWLRSWWSSKRAVLNLSVYIEIKRGNKCSVELTSFESTTKLRIESAGWMKDLVIFRYAHNSVHAVTITLPHRTEFWLAWTIVQTWEVWCDKRHVQSAYPLHPILS